MTKIKLCGLTRLCDIEVANQLSPDYIGFVFAPKSRRYLPPEKAAKLKQHLLPKISAVGVFVNESPKKIAELLNEGIIDIAQLHGNEDEEYLGRLRTLIDANCPRQTHFVPPIIKAFRIRDERDLIAAQNCTADYVLLDSGEGGTGMTFDWKLLGSMKHLESRYFLAGGLTPGNVRKAVTTLRPYGVDVSSGIETDGQKDAQKMSTFVRAVRNAVL